MYYEPGDEGCHHYPSHEKWGGGGPLEETWGHQRSRDSILGRKIHQQTCPASLLCCLDGWSQQFTVWGLFFLVVRLDEAEFISLPSGRGGKSIASSRVDMITLP